MRRSINKGDVNPVISTMANPFLGSVIKGQTIPLIAVDTTPEGIVLIKEETDIKLIMDKHLSFGFDKLEKETSYSRDELYKILGDRTNV